MPNINTYRRFLSGRRQMNPYDADAQAYFDAIDAVDGSYLPTSHRVATNNLIAGLKAATDDIWTNHIDEFYTFQGSVADAGIIGLKQAFNCTKGSATEDKHFSNYGFHSEDVANVSLRTGYIPNDNFNSIDDCGFGAHWVQDPSYTTQYIVCGNTSGGQYRLTNVPTSNTSFGQIGGGNTADVQYNDGSNTTFYGLKIINRPSSARMTYWQDGVAVTERTTGLLSAAPTAQQAIGSDELGSQRFAGRISCVFYFKASLSDAQVGEFNAIVKTWLIAMGRYVEPELYAGFVAMSEIDNKFIEAYSVAAQEAGMTPTIFGKLHTLHALHKGATDGLVNLVNPGTYDGTLINAPAMQANGMVSDDVSEAFFNSTITTSDYTAISTAFNLQYFQNDIANLPNNAAYFGYNDGGIDRAFLRVAHFGINRKFSYAWGSGSNTLYEWDSTAIEVKGAVGVNCYDRGSGNTVDFFFNGAMTGVEGTIGSPPSVGTTGLGCMGLNATVTPLTNVSDICSLSINGEGLTDAEALIVADFSEKAMTKLGISAVNTTETTSTEVETYFEEILADSAVEIGAQEARAKNKAIQELVNSGIWAESDVIQFYATIEQSDANLVHDLKNGTSYGGSVINSPNKTIEGAEGNAVDAYINSGFNLLADAVNYTINDASQSAFIVKNVSSGDFAGGRNGNNGNVMLFKLNTGTGIIEARTNSTNAQASYTLIPSDPTSNFLTTGYKTEADFHRYKFNGDNSKVGVLATPTNIIANADYFVLAWSNAGTPSGIGDAIISNIVIGSSSIEHDKLKQINVNYLLRLKGYEIALAY
jgi:hypothetical protein